MIGFIREEWLDATAFDNNPAMKRRVKIVIYIAILGLIYAYIHLYVSVVLFFNPQRNFMIELPWWEKVLDWFEE